MDDNNSKKKPNIMVFDVEATRLHGRGFAVGAVVINKITNKILAAFSLLSTDGADSANIWVRENVLPHLEDMPTCRELHTLNDEFYCFYKKWKDSCDIWSDCNFPVETTFLADVARGDINQREFEMPYPLYDLCNFMSADIDRYKEIGEMAGVVKHNPVYDSVTSAVFILDIVAFRNQAPWHYCETNYEFSAEIPEANAFEQELVPALQAILDQAIKQKKYI